MCLLKISVGLADYLSDSSHPISLHHIIKAHQKTARMDPRWARSYSDHDAVSRPPFDFAAIHVHFWPVRGESSIRRLCRRLRTIYTSPDPNSSLDVSADDSSFLSRLARNDQPSSLFLVFSDPTARWRDG